MNERIKLLKHQASVWCDENIPEQFSEETNGYGQAWEDKFAELIVQECMDLALSEQKRYAAFTHRNLSECAVTVSNFRLLIKDHFGVES